MPFLPGFAVVWAPWTLQEGPRRAMASRRANLFMAMSRAPLKGPVTLPAVITSHYRTECLISPRPRAHLVFLTSVAFTGIGWESWHVGSLWMSRNNNNGGSGGGWLFSSHVRIWREGSTNHFSPAFFFFFFFFFCSVDQLAQTDSTLSTRISPQWLSVPWRVE